LKNGLVLQIDNLSIRAYKASDIDSLVANADEKEVWRNLRDRFPHPYTKKDAREWIELASDFRPVTNFAITVDDQCVGGIGLALNQDVHRKSGEIGYWLGKKFWGQGIVSRLLGPTTDYFFSEHDIVRIYAFVFDWNPASARVLKKAGYECEGRLKKSVFKDGNYCDQLMFARIKQEL